MKRKTGELIDLPLDWIVATLEGRTPVLYQGSPYVEIPESQERYLPFLWGYQRAAYSQAWEQGGPIIDREKISVGHAWDYAQKHHQSLWHAMTDYRMLHAYGPTALIAAMRCYVASKLGDEVEIPEELVS